MFVNTNVAALNAWRNLENTQVDLTNVLQQLSSGYRINTAADDPAGLAISQQMLSQIGGLNQAYTNAQSGVSLLQTADGALGQIQNILQSMRNLASEAATSTMNATDTSNLQDEMNQYAQEITQITNTTTFNDLNLLSGAFGGSNATNPQAQVIQIGANQGETLSISINPMDAVSLGVAGSVANITGPTTPVAVSTTAPASGTLQSGGTIGQTASPLISLETQSKAVVGLSGNYTVAENYTPWSISSFSDANSTGMQFLGDYTASTNTQYQVQVTYNSSGAVTGVQYSTDGGTSWNTAGTVSSGIFSLGNGLEVALGTVSGNASKTVTVSFTANAQSTTFTLQSATGSTIGTQTLYGTQNNATVSLQNASGSEQLSFTANIGTVQVTGTAGITPSATTNGSVAFTTTGNPADASVNVSADGTVATPTGNGVLTQAQWATVNSGLDITNLTDAQAAITAIDNAINTVSQERATLGAYQNRLQFAASDVQTASQNLQSARAGIMDTDMALEMSNLSKDQVLEQSGVAMLAQANAIPQALLKLLG